MPSMQVSQTVRTAERCPPPLFFPPRFPDHLNCVSVSGKLFVVGGFDGSHALRCVEVFDPARNDWKMLGSMTSSRSNAGLAMLGESIYAVGGFDGNDFLNTLEMYNPATDEWNDCANSSSPSD